MSYSFEVHDFDAGGRIGQIKLNHKILDTPNLFPVVNPFQNKISPRRLYDHFKAQALFTNAYIIYKNRQPNPEILEKGLHAHLDFPGLIATDSGGFQDYMYAGDIKLTPEEIEPFQEALGSDFPVILDIPVQTTDSYEVAKNKVEITLQRAKENVSQRTRQNAAWFGPIHGSIYSDLLKKSAVGMSKLDYGIYAIGGVVKTFIDYRFDLDVQILLETKKWIRPDRPLHMFGLGLPAFFSLAVACGADTFDSAAYILYAKDDRYFTLTGTKNIQDLSELPCHCPICSSLTALELQQLPKPDRIGAIAEHNLYHSFSELKTIRQSIQEGTLWDLVEQRVHAHPKFIKALQVVKQYPAYFQSMLNFSKNKGQQILSEFSFFRPSMEYYRQKASAFAIPKAKTHLFLLPELDLAGINSPTVRHWVKQVQTGSRNNDSQIVIVSNILGVIPLQLSEIYPAGQHEGVNPFGNNLEHRGILENNFSSFINANADRILSATIYHPTDFINEYSETEPFNLGIHFISCLPSLLKRILPNIPLGVISHLEEPNPF